MNLTKHLIFSFILLQLMKLSLILTKHSLIKIQYLNSVHYELLKNKLLDQKLEINKKNWIIH